MIQNFFIISDHSQTNNCHIIWVNNINTLRSRYPDSPQSVLQIQYKPCNVITLGHAKSNNIEQIITIIDCFHLVTLSKWEVLRLLLTIDYIKRLSLY